MLETQAQYLNESFDKQLAVSQLALLNDDILAAEKQLARLNQEKDQLARTLDDLKFNFDELSVERDKLAAPPDRASTDISQFFQYLSRLEEREVETRARLESHKQLGADLAHQRNILTQRNKKLHAELEALATKLDDEQQLLTDSQEVLNEVDVAVQKENEENEFLVERCNELKAELESRSEALKTGEMARADELAGVERELKAELEQLRRQVEEARQEYRTAVREGQKAINAAHAECDESSSVAKWKSNREVLKAKLKRLRTALASEQRTSELTQKRDQELAQKLEEMTGSPEGDSERARAVVAAEIEDRKDNGQHEDEEAELKAEQRYAEELEAQLELVKNTAAEFEAARGEQIAGLGCELDACAGHGYLETLYAELKHLQTKVAGV